MAKKEDRKKQKKRRKEQTKARKRMQRGKYPRIAVLRDGEDPAFMTTVEEILADFAFDDEADCTLEEREMYKFFRHSGVEGIDELIAREPIQALIRERNQTEEELRSSLVKPLYAHLGEWIFARLPEEYRRNPLPFHFYQVLPAEKQLVVTFDFLSHTSGPYGTIYFSPLEPTLEGTDGKTKVGFTRHAIERACERLAPELPITYSYFQPIANHFLRCDYFELIDLPGAQPVMRLLGICGTELKKIYLQDIASLSEKKIASGRNYFVLGYCPVDFVRDFAVAKTLLSPGFRGTPEAHLVDTARIHSRQRERLRAEVSNNTLAEVLSGRRTKVLKWYHDNGVPQVVTLDRDLYRLATDDE